MGYAPKKDFMFKGLISFNKAFGASYAQRATGAGFDTFDWITNEQLTDDSLKLKEAYWLWMTTIGDYKTTWSDGRRPATNGYLVNLRDDDKAKSPMGHIINMEFDGASISLRLGDVLPGMYVKLCAGRGLTNATSWASQTQPNYTQDDKSLDNTDMVGLIVRPYDDGQYSLMMKYYRGYDVPGINTTTNKLQTVGNVDGAALSAKVEGIGDEINDFLDETIVFASLAVSKTDPKSGISMLGSDDTLKGYSYWIGTQMPNMTGGKFGLEYNYGSQNWRSFTYGEDTLIGSKMATRGNAFEAYWTQPIIDKTFTMQVRFTQINYDYTGSNGFFGDNGKAVSIDSTSAKTMSAVESASDLRIYFRYRY